MKQALLILGTFLLITAFVLLCMTIGFQLGRIFSAIECRDYGQTSVAGLTVKCWNTEKIDENKTREA